MIKLYNYIGKTFFIMALSMLCSFFCTILLAKKMSFESFGLFTLVKSMLPLLSIISLAGFEKAYTRKFANQEIKSVSHYLFIFILGISFVISFLFTYVYNISGYFIYILIGSTFGAINTFLTSYFRLKNHYLFAQFILSGHKIVFFIFIFSLLYSGKFITDNLSIGLLSISMVVPSILYSIYFFKRKPKYNKIDSFSDFFELYRFGFIFFIVGALNLIIITIDKWIIPILFNNEILGIYTALGFVCITVYSMFGSAIGYVIFPELLKQKDLDIKKIIVSVSVVPIAISLMFLFLGETINDLVYEGKYNEWQNFKLNIYFFVIGLGQFFNAIIHWIMLSKGNKKIIFSYIRYMILQIAGIIIIVALFYKRVYPDIDMIAFFAMIIILIKLVITILFINQTRYIKK